MTTRPGVTDIRQARSNRFQPAYLDLFYSGELLKRSQLAREHLHRCDLCAQYCRVDRSLDEAKTVCRTGIHARLHESVNCSIREAPLGDDSSVGSLQFAGCNLRCEYCQDWRVSQSGEGQLVNAEQLAETLLERQQQGYLKVDLVSPSHVVAQILEALVIACERGFSLPLIYSSGGYDSLEALQLLDGVIDIYAPDIKYGDNIPARKYSHVRNYVEYSHIALREMHRQVGDLIINEDGIARRGLLVRHLVLPANQAATKRVLAHISADISPDTYVNLMDGYEPRYHAHTYDKLNRPISETEIRQAIRCGDRCGLHRLDLHMSRNWTTL